MNTRAAILEVTGAELPMRNFVISFRRRIAARGTRIVAVYGIEDVARPLQRLATCSKNRAQTGPWWPPDVINSYQISIFLIYKFGRSVYRGAGHQSLKVGQCLLHTHRHQSAQSQMDPVATA